MPDIRSVMHWIRHDMISWIQRNVLLAAIAGFTIWWLGRDIAPLLDTIKQIIVIEVLAIVLSAIAGAAYTHINFSKEERGIDVLGKIFLGVHILVGLAVLGIFFTEWTPPVN